MQPKDPLATCIKDAHRPSDFTTEQHLLTIAVTLVRHLDSEP
jgi:hypothetical protein